MMLTNVTKPTQTKKETNNGGAETASPWRFNGHDFDPSEVGKSEGFVYCITNLKTGQKYVGRKYFWSIQKTKGKIRRQRKPSDWQTYFSSSAVLQEQVSTFGVQAFRRDILSLHATRGDTNYTEVKTQFILNVLERDDYINDAIGKYRKRPTERIITGRKTANTVGL